jgi:hypothetical protein
MLLEGSNTQIAMTDTERPARPISCGSAASYVVSSAEPTAFEVVWRRDGWLALKSNDTFLCAEPDGRVTLFRTICGNWENFLPADPPLPEIKGESARSRPSLSISCIETRRSEIDRAARAVERTASCIRVDTVYWFSTLTFPVSLAGIDVIHVPIDHFTDYIEDINTIFLRLIPSTVQTDFNLIVQADGFAVNPQAWDPLFWDYDYIGAPFCGLWGGGPYWRRPIVGNGGFSLRSQKFYQAIRELDITWRLDDWLAEHDWLGDFAYYILNAKGEKCLQEDVLFSLCARNMLERQFAIRFCPPELAAKFSLFEVHPFTRFWLGRSFGFHGRLLASHYGVTL